MWLSAGRAGRASSCTTGLTHPSTSPPFPSPQLDFALSLETWVGRGHLPFPLPCTVRAQLPSALCVSVPGNPSWLPQWSRTCVPSCDKVCLGSRASLALWPGTDWSAPQQALLCVCPSQLWWHPQNGLQSPRWPLRQHAVPHPGPSHPSVPSRAPGGCQLGRGRGGGEYRRSQVQRPAEGQGHSLCVTGMSKHCPTPVGKLKLREGECPGPSSTVTAARRACLGRTMSPVDRRGRGPGSVLRR